jgi:S-adenosyl-L-methionine hydrolase (adenosine-forming)
MDKTHGIVTILTDFGTADVYVGVMKGVMLQINPDLILVDLTHDIPPQNVAAGSFQLQNAYRHFPVGTVHLAVVDPGVGSCRRAIALETEVGFFVGPDNGLFSRILQLEGVKSAILLNQPRYWYKPIPSLTFHGRDIFAPIAAYLASGISLVELGDPIPLDSLTILPAEMYQSSPLGIRGQIQAVDRFGNLISNIPGDLVQLRDWSVAVGARHFPKRLTYAEAAWGEPLSLVGSHGWVELAIQGESAQQMLDIHIGDSIELSWATCSSDVLP